LIHMQLKKKKEKRKEKFGGSNISLGEDFVT
jgi:hypothetical protein